MKMIRITLEGKTYEVGVEVLDTSHAVTMPTNTPPPAAIATPVPAAPVVAPVAPAVPSPTPSSDQTVNSPMPGIVFKLRVTPGEKVTQNQELLVLEAMKMESPIYAPCAGTVSSILVREGDSVNEGQPLIQIR